MRAALQTEDTQTTSLLSLDETVAAVSGRCVCSDSAAAGFRFISVATDSRNVRPGTLFVPLVGERQDGHAFVLPALEAGASAVFVDEESRDCMDSLFTELQEEYPSAVFIVVRNTLHALQSLAACYVRKFPGLVRIGITGSSGKTTTKEIVAAILSRRFSVVMSEGNLNSETGLPLSVFRIRKEHEVGVFELGMNRPGEIGELAAVLRPNLAVITNIGQAHVGMLGSCDAIAREKKRIFSCFDGGCTAFVPSADRYAQFLAEGVPGKVVRYDTSVFSGVEADGLAGTRLTLDGLGIRFPLPGRGSLCDAAAAVAVARELGCSAEEIKAGLESVRPLFGRGQVVVSDVSVIQDCYNANPDSMAQALEFLGSLEVAEGRRIAVLGDMLELGEESPAAHAEAVSAALDCGAAVVVCVGEEMCRAASAAGASSSGRGRLACFPDTGDEGIGLAADFLRRNTRKGDVVLLKGSRGVRLERLTPSLSGGAL